MGDPTRIRPFSQGTQFYDWLSQNCDRCSKSFYANNETLVCDLDGALSFACVDDGTIPADIAARLGVPKQTWSDWQCKEFAPMRGPDDPEPRKPDLPGQSLMF